MNGSFSPIVSSTATIRLWRALGPHLLLVEGDRSVEFFELRARNRRLRGALREQPQHLGIREGREGRIRAGGCLQLGDVLRPERGLSVKWIAPAVEHERRQDGDVPGYRRVAIPSGMPRTLSKRFRRPTRWTIPTNAEPGRSRRERARQLSARYAGPLLRSLPQTRSIEPASTYGSRSCGAWRLLPKTPCSARTTLPERSDGWFSAVRRVTTLEFR